ncbi:HU family DNA-binding protein [Burkholderia cenocepacia]|uniref:HU family DNA-binding protein n=1 Tax=Burkholderia TaxID=32008 RepID=UPI00031F2F28|nr:MULTISPECIES: HU family DNA-binding protein [Burkholderia]MBR8043153.1 HU family DNA-binding protein [Burkholderia cenocepacia]MBR8324477.1 HU family DNA-binding protein [Burkholderia cenocepacia]
MNLNKQEFARKIAAKHEITVRQAYQIVEDLHQHVVECLVKDQVLIWKGLGTIRVIPWKNRVVKIPTGVHTRRPGAVRSTFKLAGEIQQTIERRIAECMDHETVDSSNDQR